MTITNLAEAQDALWLFMRGRTEMTRKNTTLERISPLMDTLGNPQNQMRVIHVAGTSGKTSTAYYIAALLTAAGQKTGLTVSPHIDSITERLQINGQPISEATFCQQLGEFIDLVKQTEFQPTYYELSCAFVFWYMAQQQLDYLIVETGVGGLYDATNVANRADKVCVITDIGYDHMALLGNTLPEIATQKIGIAHPGNRVLMYRQGEEIMRAIERGVAAHQAVLHLTQGASVNYLETMPDYQQRNWSLAYEVYQMLAKRDGLPGLNFQQLASTQAIVVPARMEIKQVQGKTLIMDGAHNVQKLEAFLGSLKHLYPAIKPALLVAFKHDKEYEELVSLLAPLASRIITTSFDTKQDLPVVSMDPDELAEAFHAAGVPAESIPDHTTALEALLGGPENVCIITGSFYLLGELRHNRQLQ